MSGIVAERVVHTDHIVARESTLTSTRAERVAVAGLLLLYLASAYGFAAATPYGEAPDEFGHFAYVEHLVRFGTFPQIARRPYTIDAFHPPLYYMLGAAVVIAGRPLIGEPAHGGHIAPVVLGDPDSILHREGGSKLSLLLHPPEHRWPLWPYAIRGVSILMGLGVVALTYATARTLVPPPASETVPLLATAFAALIPEANFIRASVSNENLAELIGAWVVWLLVMHLMRPYSSRRLLWLGVAFGLGLLTKLSVAPLALPALCVLWVRREGQAKRFLRDAAVIAVAAIAIAGWYYAYRWLVYGDPLAIAAWREMIPSNSTWTLLDLFWFQEPFRWLLWTSFWGTFGWNVIFMPDWIYSAFIGVTVLAALGCIYLLVRRALGKPQQASCAVMLAALLLMYAMVILASTYLIAWQGREMYPALSSFCVLLGLGLGALVLGRAAVRPATLRTWQLLAARGLLATATIGLLALNLYSIIWLVIPGLNSSSLP